MDTGILNQHYILYLNGIVEKQRSLVTEFATGLGGTEHGIATLCAERVAIGKAISDGGKDFLAIAIVGSGNDYCYPCGICRQVMSEFCRSDFKIVLPLENNETRVMSLEELLPYSFTNKNMK